jgi:hypothetical protein
MSATGQYQTATINNNSTVINNSFSIINGNNLEVKNVQPDRSMLNAEYQLVCRLIFF